MRDATLAINKVTLAMRVALFSISWASVVHSMVTAAARLSRYPLSQVKVSGEIVVSSAAVTVLAIPPYKTVQIERRHRHFGGKEIDKNVIFCGPF